MSTRRERLIERLRESLTYWYFRFPKWLWTGLIFTLLILFHVWIGTSFPVQWMYYREVESEAQWYGRIAAFYFAVLGGGILLIFIGCVLVVVIGRIHNFLPDDPRKKKKNETEAETA